MHKGEFEELAVTACGLGKYYLRHVSTWSRILDFGVFMLRGRRAHRFSNMVHVLRDIELSVPRGRSLGIIGNNGCGKSTLLKMIAGILAPSTGQLQVRGRVASIIELGAGFNSEDSGRQNIYSYLVMYGISRDAFGKKIPQIIEFSGLSEKIDDPVKTYSSGMVVRLAFAIIAHLDAEILLVDEALAVGDAIFAQKCMRFIKSFKAEGTVLFVSHDLNALQNLCDEVIWLHDGAIRQQGAARQVCDAYLAYTLTQDYSEEIKSVTMKRETIQKGAQYTNLALEPPTSEIKVVSDLDLSNGFGGQLAEIEDVWLHQDEAGEEATNAVLRDGAHLALTVRVRAKDDITHPIVGFLLKNSRGVEIFGENTLYVSQKEPFALARDTLTDVMFRFRMPILPSGDYTISVAVADGDFHDHRSLVWRHDVLVLRVFSERFRYGMLGLSNSTIEVNKEIT